MKAKPASTRGRGRPETIVTATTREMVETMAGVGVPERDIARVVGMDAKTLRKHCREELDTGFIRANAKVSGNLLKIATGEGTGAVTAAIWWEKTRQGRSEKIVNEVTPADGAKSFSHEHRHSLDPASAQLIADLIK
jgi:hypothetical protein